ncbi:hypothetical protein [Paenibacillus dendritiformis]|uniref:hypothetical protein n=1 Tax=Paenibacillus dendritiformis TaxID=130049 RepID=UPI001BD12781|nr:hypothetical protein [Paenibacillus dendritiformis]
MFDVYGHYFNEADHPIPKSSTPKGKQSHTGDGYGPGASFGLAVAADNYDQIKGGFTVGYYGLIRYEYVKL